MFSLTREEIMGVMKEWVAIENFQNLENIQIFNSFLFILPNRNSKQIEIFQNCISVLGMYDWNLYSFYLFFTG